MIQALKLTEESLITEIRMENLGKINVICGKNSSGKTTLLKAIERNSDLNIGKKLTLHVIQEMKNFWLEYADKSTISIAGISHSYRTAFNQLCSVDRIFTEFERIDIYFYRDDYKKIGNYFLDFAEKFHYSDDHPQTYGILQFIKQKNESDRNELATIIAGIISKPLGDLFTKTTKPSNYINQETPSIYITPKRKVSTSTNLTLPQDVSGDGAGLIERIFHYKSSLPDSPNRKFYEHFYEIFSQVTEAFKFDIVMVFDIELKLKLYFSPTNKEKWVNAENAGLGLQDLFVIIYFALSHSSSFDKKLLLIEEPENHLHPDMQRRLLRFLSEHTPDNTQFIISTHSNVFLDSTYVDRVFLSKFEDEKIALTDASTKSQILSELGYSVLDNLVSDLIILVEGSTDKVFLQHILNLQGSLLEKRIGFWILCGDNMSNIELDNFNTSYKMIAFLDNDPKCDREPFFEECDKNNIEIFTLQRYSIESYIPTRVFQESFPMIKDKDLFDHEKPIWGQLPGADRKGIKRGVKKFVPKMELADLDNTDILDFLDKVEQILDSI